MNLLISFLKIHLYLNKSYVTKNINIIIENHNLSYLDIFVGRKIKFSLQSLDNCWRIKMIKEILHMRDFELFDVLNIDETNNLLQYLCCI